MNGCFSILFILGIIVFGGALLMQDAPVVGMIIVGAIITALFIAVAKTGSISNNTTTNKSINYGNPIMPHMYRKQIRRYFKRR